MPQVDGPWHFAMNNGQHLLGKTARHELLPDMTSVAHCKLHCRKHAEQRQAAGGSWLARGQPALP